MDHILTLFEPGEDTILDVKFWSNIPIVHQRMHNPSSTSNFLKNPLINIILVF